MATILLLAIAFVVGLGIHYVTNLRFEIREKIRNERIICDAEYTVLEDENREKLD